MVFTKNSKPSIQSDLPPNSVRFTNAQGPTTELKCVSPNSRIEMLGICKAVDLQETTKKDHIHKKAGWYLKAISAYPLKAHEVWISYTTVLNSSITYSLACTFFALKEFTALNTCTFPLFISHLGGQCNFLHDIAFGPKFAEGNGYIHYTATQLSQIVTNIIKHVQAQIKIGKKFHMLLHWTQLFTGTRKPLLVDTKPLPHLE
eukprot:14958731-Ditylum_brightwellii.AAC.2